MAGSVRFALTIDDIVTAQRLAYVRALIGRRTLLICLTLLAAAAVLLACRSVPNVAGIGDLWLVPIGLLVGVTIGCVVRFLMIPGRARRSVRQQPGLLEEARWTWGDDGIETVSDGGSARFKWRELYRAYHGRRAFVLNPQTRLIYILPRRMLSADQQRDLEALVARFARGRRQA